MNIIKLKKIFILCLIGLLVLIMATSCNFNEIINNEDTAKPTDTNVDTVHKLEEFDYNNLSTTQKDYLSTIYSNNIKFTEKGVEVYLESSENLSKIITSTWPEEEIAYLIPKPEYGELDRIEYAETFINVYINNAKKSDANNYLKELKKYNFNKNEQKDDGKVMLGYNISDELGNNVQITYFKESKILEISARKK